MRRGIGLAVPAVLTALVLGACTGEGVPRSTLPPQPVAAVPGPAYAVRPLSERGPAVVVVDGSQQSLGRRVDGVTWMPGGHLLVARREPETFDLDVDVVDPATGEVLDGHTLPDALGVTPEAVTVHYGTTTGLTVLSPLLEPVDEIQVRTDDIDSDQPADAYADLTLIGSPFTLDGVTWVEWGINSEDDFRSTDHGVLRIEDGEVEEVLRDEPVVRLQPSTDGAALLAVMQDEGGDQDCGGCIVRQSIVELDPDSGDIAADFDTPPGYTKLWRIDAFDKIGDLVVVRYEIDVRGPRTASLLETWIYDGEWRHETSSDGTRTSWQDGGRLVWRRVDLSGGRDKRVYDELTWHPTAGDPVELLGRDRLCPTNDSGFEMCPEITLAGSLLPRPLS